MTSQLLAQIGHTIGTFTGIGPLGNAALESTGNTLELFERTLSRVIAFITIAACLWFMIQIITGAFSWISSSGDKQALQTAQKKIINGLIGFTLVLLSYVIIGLVGRFFGINIFNVAQMLTTIAPP